MEVVSATWFSEMGMDEYNIFDQFGFTSDHDLLGETNFKQSLSSESHNSSYSPITTNNPSNATSCGSDSAKNNSQPAAGFDMPRPTKQLKSSQILSFEQNSSNPLPSIVTKAYHHERKLYPEKSSNLEISNLLMKPKREDDHEHYYAPKVTKDSGNKRTYSSMTRTPSHAQDHIMAERKRREKLSQRFIALSAIVPGLKKMDKASVLGDAIKYLKELKERVINLEEQTKRRTVESVVLVKKSQLLLSTDDDTSSTNESSDGNNPMIEDSLPEIEARVSDKDVLIRIHCEKQKGLVANIFGEVEKLGLSILNSSVVPFGNSTLDITIVAQMENEFKMTVKDIVKNVRLALLKIIM